MDNVKSMRNMKSMRDMKYITLKVYTKELDKQKVLHTFFSDYIDENRTGLILKFNNSIGFRDVANQFDEVTKNTVWRKVDTPKEYLAPMELLISGVYWLHGKDEIVTFIIPNKTMKFDNYDYNTLEMAIKFQNFLYKVLGDKIRIEIKIGSKPKISLKDGVLSYVYCTMANGEYYSCEMSLPRLLKDKEVEYILTKMREHVTFEPTIEQYECATCKEYHPDKPIHFEFCKRKVMEKIYNECIEYGCIPQDSVIKALER